jgi:MFS family permease
LALAANLFFFAGFQWTFATLPGYVQEIGGDAAGIGLAYGLFSLSAVAARPVVGWLVDHWGRKPVMLVGATLFVLSPALYPMLHSLWPFMVVRVFHGVGIAASTTAYTALVADLAPPGRRGEAIGLSGVTNNLGMLFAPVLGVYVLTAAGYAAHFWVSAGITMVSLLLLLPVREPVREALARSDSPSRDFGVKRLPAPSPAPEPPSGTGVRPTFAQDTSLWAVAHLRPVWVASFGITGLAVAYGAVLSFLAPHAAEQGLTAAGSYFSAFALAMISAQALAGWLSDRIGRRAVAIPGMILAAPAVVGLALAHTDLALLAAGAVFGLSWGLARAGIDTTVVDAVAPEVRGTAVGFLYTCFDIGVGAGSFGLGVIAQAQGYAAAFYTAAIWAVLALAGYIVWGRRKP